MRRVVPCLVPCLVSVLLACSATPTPPRRDGGGLGSDAGPSATQDGSTRPDSGTPMAGGPCQSFLDCPSNFVCRAVQGRLVCVPPDTRPNPDDCGVCPSPGECRGTVCVQPEMRGSVCEFDSSCGMGFLCIAARCTPDPRVPRPCDSGNVCPGALQCTMGTCRCTNNADCPVGTVCTIATGQCTATPGPGTGCIADSQCPPQNFCEGGICTENAACQISNPNLAGTWNLRSTLRLRESLPSWLSSFLNFVSGPFRFISDPTSMDLGTNLPQLVEDLIEPALRDWADQNLPLWARQLLGSIADINDILSVWTIDETMTLMPGASRDLYRGSHTWNTVSFTFRGMTVRGRPQDIMNWSFTPSDFDAAAVCGVFTIDRHDVNVSIGAIIAWLIDTIVYEVSDRRFRTLGDALGSITGAFCTEAGRIARDAAPSYPGVESTVTGACNSLSRSLIDNAVRVVVNARIGADLLTLKGFSPIPGPNALRPGTWEGTLAGRSFTGDFDASR